MPLATSRSTMVQRLADFLLPRVCAACGAEQQGDDESVVCGLCWTRCISLPHPQCERCGHPVRASECSWCALLPPYVRSARSVCWMPDGAAGAIVHAFKYDGWYTLAPGIGDRMARASFPADVSTERTALVPVPLSRDRERERGYNQCRLLADAVARRWAIPVWDDVLVRPRNTRAQAQLTPDQRLTNVANAFEVAGKRRGCVMLTSLSSTMS
jgi:predicted amidophosphoribosyltransferase